MDPCGDGCCGLRITVSACAGVMPSASTAARLAAKAAARRVQVRVFIRLSQSADDHDSTVQQHQCYIPTRPPRNGRVATSGQALAPADVHNGYGTIRTASPVRTVRRSRRMFARRSRTRPEQRASRRVRQPVPDRCDLDDGWRQASLRPRCDLGIYPSGASWRYGLRFAPGA